MFCRPERDRSSFASPHIPTVPQPRASPAGTIELANIRSIQREDGHVHLLRSVHNSGLLGLTEAFAFTQRSCDMMPSMFRILSVVVMLGACVSSDVVHCDDGRV